MSGLSKALHLAVFAGLISGCTVSNTVSQPDQIDDVAALTEQNTAAPVEAAASPEQLTTVAQSGLDIAVTRDSGSTSFSIASESAIPRHEVFEMTEPSRVVVDVFGNNSTMPGTYTVNDPLVRSVRVGRHTDRTRIVFDLAENTIPAHTANGVDGKVVLTFNSGTTAAAAPAETEASPMVRAELPVTEESAPVVTESEPEIVEAKAAETATVDAVTLGRSSNAPTGEVKVNLSSQVPFDLRQTAPTEYTLKIIGASAAEESLIPQLAPAEIRGIRSTRTVQEGGNVLVRMFVDSNVTLSAAPKGNEILVTANLNQLAQSPEARAQLQQPEPPAPPAEAPAETRVAETDEETARRNPTGVPSADGSKIYTGRLISLDLQETDIDNALRIIAEVSNLNIIASDDVTGKVTLRLIDVPWDQALDVILKTNGLDQVTEGNVIRIAPVEKLRQEREALREAKKAAQNLEDLKVRYIRVSYARASDLKPQVESVLSERGSVEIDERTNQLIVKDITGGQNEVMQLIKKLDLRTPQVLLETQIVEASRGIIRDLGFQWNFNYAQAPAFGNATGLNFPNSIVLGGSMAQPARAGGASIGLGLESADGSRALSMLLTAFEQEGKVRVISRPQVATVNNKQAEIKSVETVRVKLPTSGTSVATGSGATASAGGTAAFEEIDVGIELRVTPQASPDYYVLLDINAKSSTFGDRQVDGIPSTREREATSTVLVKSGQTFALGGVYRIEDTNNLTGLPFLKDLPALGHLFRRDNLENTDQELIFFITPHIVEGSFDPSLM